MNARNPWFVAGFLTGCAVAAAVALLYAPAAGEQTLAAIREHFQRANDAAREAGRRTEADILSRYKRVRAASLAPAPGAPRLAPAMA